MKEQNARFACTGRTRAAIAAALAHATPGFFTSNARRSCGAQHLVWCGMEARPSFCKMDGDFTRATHQQGEGAKKSEKQPSLDY